ncbi:MAG: DUF134 domain-containing protein [Promethearchaeota archaeon]|jgi:predicted DNA-binding protein (UPF0251 family)/DNA-directed RNA polymerase subunit RPC12/RpoP
MGRRRQQRWVHHTPDNFYFPTVTPTKEDCIILTVAEFEAMRLKHYTGLNQKLASEKMGISQPTFSRVLEAAHQKATLALIEGKPIKIHGGNVDYKLSFIGYGCLDCNHEWEDSSASKDRKVNCTHCDSQNVYFIVRELI